MASTRLEAPGVSNWALGAQLDSSEATGIRYTTIAVVLGIDLAAAGGLDEEGLVVLVRRLAEDGPYAGHLALPEFEVNLFADQDSLTVLQRELASLLGQASGSFVTEWLRMYDAYGRDPRQFAMDAAGNSCGPRTISTAHVVFFSSPDYSAPPPGFHWLPVYRCLPWEQAIAANGAHARSAVAEMLAEWVGGNEERLRLVRHSFGAGTVSVGESFALAWNEGLAGERFRLLTRARLVQEAFRDRWGTLRDWENPLGYFAGEALAFDHRQVLADALSLTRDRIKHFPRCLKAVLPEEFTLIDLRYAVMNFLGRTVTKTNFWRLVGRGEFQALLEPLDKSVLPREKGSGPRAKLYRFRPEADWAYFEPAIRIPA